MGKVTFRARYDQTTELWDVAIYDGRNLAGVRASFNTEAEARDAARMDQADEDAGLTILGTPTDDHRAIEAGMTSEVLSYYDALPALVASIGVEKAEAQHPWRARQAA